MNLGSMDLKLVGLDATRARYRSEAGSTELVIPRVNVQQDRRIAQKIEIKLWVDADEFRNGDDFIGTAS